MSSTNRGVERNPRDFYVTPAWCVDQLVDQLNPDAVRKLAWGEPCWGTGVIPETMGMRYPGIPSWNWAELSMGRDYLTEGLTGEVDAIATNPPFSLFEPFLDKAIEDAKFVAFLLRITCLGGQKRSAWWEGKTPTHLYVMSRRASFTGDGKTDSVEYAWFVWDHLDVCLKPPGIYVLPPSTL